MTLSHFRNNRLQKYLKQNKINKEILSICIDYIKNNLDSNSYKCEIFHSKKDMLRQIKEKIYEPLYRFINVNSSLRIECVSKTDIEVNSESVYFSQCWFNTGRESGSQLVDSLTFQEPHMQIYLSQKVGGKLGEIINGNVYKITLNRGYLLIYHPKIQNDYLQKMYTFCCLDFDIILNQLRTVPNKKYFTIPNCLTYNYYDPSRMTHSHKNIHNKLNILPSLRPFFIPKYDDDGSHRPFSASTFSVNIASTLNLVATPNRVSPINIENYKDSYIVNSPFLYIFLNEAEIINNIGVFK